MLSLEEEKSKGLIYLIDFMLWKYRFNEEHYSRVQLMVREHKDTFLEETCFRQFIIMEAHKFSVMHLYSMFYKQINLGYPFL